MRMIRSATLLVATALMALGLSQSASADIITYASTGLGDFGTLDLTTGVYSHVGSTGLDPGTEIYGMGYIGNTLYAVDNGTPGSWVLLDQYHDRDGHTHQYSVGFGSRRDHGKR